MNAISAMEQTSTAYLYTPQTFHYHPTSQCTDRRGPRACSSRGRGMQLRAVMRNTMEAKHMCWERVGVTRTPDACQNSPDTCQNVSRNAQCMVGRTISHARLQASPAQCCIGREYRARALARADSKTIPDWDLLHCLGTNRIVQYRYITR